MIIVKLQSGLGNQFFQYALGRNLANKYHTDLVLDIERFSKDNLRDYKLDNFQIKGRVINSRQSLKFFFREPLIFLKLKTQNFHDVTDTIWQPTDFDSIKDNSILRGYWGNERYFLNIREVLLDELKLKPEYESRQYKALSKKISEIQSVAIHIRRGDYLDDTNKHIFSLLDLNYYKKAIAFINERVAHPRFFIFSDSIPWVKSHFNFPENFEIVSDKNLLQDIHEISLMSQCKHNIMANSTFSWWGAWLNTNPDKIVIQPETWYQDEVAQTAYKESRVLNCANFIKL